MADPRRYDPFDFTRRLQWIRDWRERPGEFTAKAKGVLLGAALMRTNRGAPHTESHDIFWVGIANAEGVCEFKWLRGLSSDSPANVWLTSIKELSREGGTGGGFAAFQFSESAVNNVEKARTTAEEEGRPARIADLLVTVIQNDKSIAEEIAKHGFDRNELEKWIDGLEI